MYDQHDLQRLEEGQRHGEVYQDSSARGTNLGGSVIALAIIAVAVLGAVWIAG